MAFASSSPAITVARSIATSVPASTTDSANISPKNDHRSAVEQRRQQEADRREGEQPISDVRVRPYASIRKPMIGLKLHARYDFANRRWVAASSRP